MAVHAPRKKPTNKQLMLENANLKIEANTRIDYIANVSDQVIRDMAVDLAEVSTLNEILKNVLDQVANKSIYPHELRRWIDNFNSTEFEGTYEELAHELGLEDLQGEYRRVKEEVTRQTAERVLTLDTARLLARDYTR